MELGRWLRHAYAISIVLLLHINPSLSLGHHHANVTARCIERERDALLAIKGDLVDESNLLSSWGSEAKKRDCCRWERVHCDHQTGHVIQLHLNGGPGVISLQGEYISKTWQGEISPKIIELQHLEYLDLGHNFFNASQISALICSLSNLRHLDLKSNYLSGSKILELIGNLTNLRYLDLSEAVFGGDNDLTGRKILELIGNLTNLRYLDLSWNFLGDETSYHQLGNLTHLQYLNLGYHIHITHGVENLNWLPHLSSLKYLDLSSVDLSKATDWLETINKLPNLRNLTLSFCSLPPPTLSTLSHINSSNSLVSVDLSENPAVISSIFKWLCNYNITLVHLDLYSTKLSGLIPDVFRNMGSLEHLDLSYNQLSGLIPDVFTNMSSLEHLDLSSNQLSGLIPDVFRNMSSLVELDLSSNQLSGLILDFFTNRSSLASLDLSSNQLSGLIPDVFRNMSSLVELDLSSNQLSGLIPNVFRNMSSLVELDLSSNQLSGLIPDFFTNMSSLASLDLSSNQLNGLIHDAFANMSSFASLDISDNPFEGGIPASIGQLCSLRYVSASGCNLSSGQLSKFVQGCSACVQNSLQSFVLSNNHLTGSFPNLTNFSSLEVLILSKNKLSVLDSIGNLSSLKELYVNQNQLRWMIPESIGELSSLYVLDLSGNLLSGRIPEGIGQLSSLTDLILSGNLLSERIPEGIGQLSSLTDLILSGNQLSRSIPESIGKLSSLQRLDLSRNLLSGRIPHSIGQLSRLYYINLSMNHLAGVISETHFSKLFNLFELDLSDNELLEFNVSSDWVPPFQLFTLSLRSCTVGPDFPKWLRTQKDLSYLDMSDGDISDVLPSWFWGLFGVSSTTDLSNNQIKGTLGNLEVVPFGVQVRFGSNQLAGPMPSSLSNASYLDLSDNKFSEMTSFLCSSNVKIPIFLDLSGNHISGELPDCWRHWVNLELLDLSNNSFSGKIPPNIGFLLRIKTLKLRSNRLVGELPSSLKNCISLNVIDLGNNNLSSSVPEWLGVSLSNLVILMLQSNQFSGSLPSQLCHLARLQILDVSVNQISGTIPKCLDSLTSLAQEGNSNLTIRHSFNMSNVNAEGNMTSLYYEDDATFMWKRTLSTYKNTLGLVKSIDLSCNRLTGEIPSEITHLVGLVSLNLSRNNLTGQIPLEIGKLKSLDSLDLSRNKIGGGIPTSLARIDRLGDMDLSYNNLSGEIPTGTQLQSFDPSFYAGNPQLCGRPLEACNPEGTGGPNVSSDQADPDELITQGFYISLGLGFAVGFWVVCGSLIFKRSWRYAYYNFLNALNDWLYVRVALIRRQLKDMLSGQS